MAKRVVLAYSGGLDTSVLLTWLKETYQAEIIAFCADVGQEEELDGLEAKALRTGAALSPERTSTISLVSRACLESAPPMRRSGQSAMRTTAVPSTAPL